MSTSAAKNLRVGPLPNDPAISLEFVTNESGVKEFLNQQAMLRNHTVRKVVLKRLRYHPGASCVALYTVHLSSNEISEPRAITVYSATLSEDKFLERTEWKTNFNYRAANLPVGPLVNSDHCCLFYEFPNDAILASLPMVENPSLLMRLIPDNYDRGADLAGAGCEVSTVRYKPENRLVASLKAHTGSQFYFRIESRVVVKKLKAISSAIAGKTDLGESVRLASPLACDDVTGVVLLEGLPGEKVSEILRTKSANVGLVASTHAMVRLHSSRSIELHDFDHEHRRKSASRFLAALLRRNQEADDVSMRLRSWIDQRFDSIPSPNSVLIHGDFHPGQVLYDEEKTSIIDIDRLSRGPAEADMGNYLAQLCFLKERGRLIGCDGFQAEVLCQYEAESSRQLNYELVSYYKVLGLIELAAKQFRRLKPNWPTKVKTLIDHAVAAVEEGTVLK